MQLPKQTTGPLAGYPLLAVDMVKFAAYKQAAYDKGVDYGLGAKDPHLGAWPIDYTKIDCSGFVRAILAYSTNGQTVKFGMPDGSFLESDWFKAQGFKAINYSQVPDYASHLCVAIHRPGGRGGDSIGHIWFCIHGHSVESYGGNGPGERPWNHAWFVRHVDEVYVIAS
jgi:hypothetical protein